MKKIFMAMIRFYRKYISPGKPPCCRFTPTCSAYAMEAFEKRGCLVGFWLMIWRILRCSPLSPCGYDPVPEKGFRTMPMRRSKYNRIKDQLPKIPLEETPVDVVDQPEDVLDAKEPAEKEKTPENPKNESDEQSMP